MSFIQKIKAYFQKGIPLSVYITSLVSVVIIVLSITLIETIQFTKERISNDTASNTFSLVVNNIDSHIQNHIYPRAALITLATTVNALNTNNSHELANSSLSPLFIKILRDNNDLLAVNHGYLDGSFYAVVSMRTDEIRKAYNADPQTEYVFWSVAIDEFGKKEEVFFHADKNGNILKQVPSTELNFYDPREKTWYIQAKDTYDVVMTEPYVFTKAQQIGVALSQQLGSGNGTLSLNILLEDFNKILQNIALTPNTVAFIFDSNRRIIAQTSNLESLIGADEILISIDKHPSELVNLLASYANCEPSETKEEKNIVEILYKGENYFFESKPFHFLNQPLKFIIATPISDFTLYLDKIFSTILFFSVFILFLFGLVSLYITKLIRKPLLELIDKAEHVKNFDFDSNKQVSSNITEVQYLADAIQSMQETLHEKTDALFTAQNHLEATIEERTHELIDARNRAEMASTAKGDFLANMSHEIRTPMNGIIGMAYLALQGDLPEKEKIYIENIDKSAKMLLYIINDILDFSKIEAGKMELEQSTFSLYQTVQSVADAMTPLAEKSQFDFQIDIAKDIPNLIVGDSVRLRQIIFNLLSNALKFTTKGQVLLRVTNEVDDGTMATLKFMVKDTGIGMSDEQMARLFTAFSQADSSITRKYGGTGLGLSIVKSLVSLMEGTIEIESELNKGSIFTVVITFPTVDEIAYPTDSSVLTSLDTNHETIRLKNKKILLVEDNDINQLIAQEFLGKVQSKVTLAYNGQECLDCLKHETFDIVLMDIQMPVMDGFEATRIIRSDSHYNTLPVIAMTAHGMSGDYEKSIRAGMQDHITKPIDADVLYETLLRWIAD